MIRASWKWMGHHWVLRFAVPGRRSDGLHAAYVTPKHPGGFAWTRLENPYNGLAAESGDGVGMDEAMRLCERGYEVFLRDDLGVGELRALVGRYEGLIRPSPPPDLGEVTLRVLLGDLARMTGAACVTCGHYAMDHARPGQGRSYLFCEAEGCDCGDYDNGQATATLPRPT
jgi:hypothetical protein